MERICDNCMSRVPADSDKCTRCGIRFENTNPGGALPNGWVLGGRYTVGRYVDIDGEGVTYSAIDGDTLQRVTIKEYMPVTLCATRDEYGAIVAKPGNEVLFKTTRMDYRELYDTLMRMGLTEGLVQVLDVLEENNTVYAVLEKVEGPTLAEYLTKVGGPVEASRSMAILRPVMMGVEAMHGANLVHRGICPENIILESGGTAKLGGFAILALRQQGSELKPKLYPGYSAPEQYAANEFEGRYTDVYALGATLYRMVTAEVPDPADERRMQDNLVAARSVNKEIPTFLSTGIARAMRLAPSERLQNISDLRLALTGEGPREKKQLPFGLTKQQLTVGAVALGAIVLLLVIVLLVVTLGGNKNNPESSTTSAMEEAGKVPNFVGLTRSYIEERWGGEDSEFTFRWEDEYSSDVEEGRVSSQTPLEGSDWDGGAITLYLSKGPNPDEYMVTIPDFSGLTLTEAQDRLNSLGIKNHTWEEIENPGNVETGRVVRTDPAARTELDTRQNPKVTIYVAGDKPVTMPNVIDLSEGDARSTLEALGLRVTVDYVTNENGQYIPGRVVKTNIDVGATLYPETSSTVVIYLAKKTAMPNLYGKTQQEAETLLNNLAGSRAAITVYYTIEYQPASLADGLVYSQSIGAGQEIDDGASVVIYVSRSATTSSGGGDSSSSDGGGGEGGAGGGDGTTEGE